MKPSKEMRIFMFTCPARKKKKNQVRSKSKDSRQTSMENIVFPFSNDDFQGKKRVFLKMNAVFK